ncbi:MAG: hypothetical protein ACXVLT_01730 [Flavisolibacter sp.]
MLTLVTKYLLRYKRVAIPNVGTFEIVARPPQLDVADKRLTSPVYLTRHNQDDHVPDHQFRYFATDGTNEGELRDALYSFGERLRKQVQTSPFHWKGLGTLRYASSTMMFEPDEIVLDSLQPISAEKVIRQNVQHSMLVGDREMNTQQVNEVLTRVEYKRPWFVILGWVLLIVSVVAIVIYLYVHNFETSSTGLGRW